MAYDSLPNPIVGALHRLPAAPLTHRWKANDSSLVPSLTLEQMWRLWWCRFRLTTLLYVGSGMWRQGRRWCDGNCKLKGGAVAAWVFIPYGLTPRVLGSSCCLSQTKQCHLVRISVFPLERTLPWEFLDSIFQAECCSSQQRPHILSARK